MEATRRGLIGGHCLDIGKGDGSLGGGDFLALIGFDLLQDIGHGLLSSSSVSLVESATALPDMLCHAGHRPAVTGSGSGRLVGNGNQTVERCGGIAAFQRLGCNPHTILQRLCLA